MSDKCKCEHTQHHCTLAENCRVALMCKRVVESETVNIDRAEHEAMKADAERWRYFRETASEEMCYALCGNSNAENEELDHAIDQARKV